MSVPAFGSIAASAAQYSATGTALVQISDPFPINVPAMNMGMNGFKIAAKGTIAQGGTLQTVTFGSRIGVGAFSSMINTGITVAIPTTAFVISTTVGFEYELECISQGQNQMFAATPVHFCAKVNLQGSTPFFSAFGVTLNFPNFLDSQGQVVTNQQVELAAQVGAVGPTVTVYLEDYVSYGW